MAVSFLSKDESQIAYYEEILKNMPIKVLAKHGVLARENNLVKLNAKDYFGAESRTHKIMRNANSGIYFFQGNCKCT